MSEEPRLKVIEAAPLGARYDLSKDEVHLTLLQDNGDYLQIVLDAQALQALCLNIQCVLDQMPPSHSTSAPEHQI